MKPVLYLFPHAGGSRFSFAFLAKCLHGFCDVIVQEYSAEPICEQAKKFAQEISKTSKPYFLFGHSLGALMAYETTFHCKPQALFVSSCSAPHDPHGPKEFHSWQGKWDEAALVRFQKAYGEIPNFMERADIRDYFFSLLKRDLCLLQKYKPTESCLRLPLYAFWGEKDLVVGKKTMSSWQKYSTGDFSLTSIPGGHFYPMELPELLAVNLKAFMSTP
jgi:surfactin synthase thioesterase subunit